MANSPNRNYPLPEPDELLSNDVTTLINALLAIDVDIESLLDAVALKAASVHTHAIADVTGLTAALAGKMPVDATFSLGQLNNVADGADSATDGSILYKAAAGWLVGSPDTLLGAHTHTIAQVTGLQAELDSKLVSANLGATILAYATKGSIVNGDSIVILDSADSNAPKRTLWSTLKAGLVGVFADIVHTHTFASLTSKPTTRSGYGITDAAASTHTHAWTDITGEPTTLAGYGITDAALASHTHTFASLTSKPTTLAGYGITDAYTEAQVDSLLAGKAASSHTHTFASLTSKPTTLAGYGITDAYTEAQVNSLLAGKADSSHTHTFASLTSKPTTVSGYGITDAAPEDAYNKIGEIAVVTTTIGAGNTGAASVWGLGGAGTWRELKRAAGSTILIQRIG